MPTLLRHVDGTDDELRALEQVDRLLEEVESLSDAEHSDVAIIAEDGWSLAVLRGGRLSLEHLDDLDVEPVHLRELPHPEIRRIAHLMAAGEFEEVRRLPWQPGYP